MPQDIFDTIEVGETAKGDIFDQIEAGTAPVNRDIFDEIAPESANGAPAASAEPPATLSLEPPLGVPEPILKPGPVASEALVETGKALRDSMAKSFAFGGPRQFTKLTPTGLEIHQYPELMLGKGGIVTPGGTVQELQGTPTQVELSTPRQPVISPNQPFVAPRQVEGPTAELTRGGQALNAFRQGAMSSTISPFQAIAKVDEIVAPYMSNPHIWREIAQGRQDVLQDAQAAIREAYPLDPRYKDEFLATTLPMGAGSLLPFALTGTISGPIVSAVTGSLMSAQAEYEAARNAGLSEEESRRSMGVGALIGLSEGAGVGRTGIKAKGVRGYVSGMVEEGGQEFFQTFATNLNAIETTGYDQQRGILDNTLESAAAGLILAGTVKLPGLAADRLEAVKAAPDPKAALRTAITETATVPPLEPDKPFDDRPAPPVLEIRDPTENVTTTMQANGMTAGARIESVPISELKGGVDMRQESEQKRVAKLADEMRSEEGYISRLLVDGENNVVEGQHRLEALRQLGITDVPVVKLFANEDFIPDVPKVKQVLRDNGVKGSDSVNRLTSIMGEVLMDENGSTADLLDYEAPPGYEQAWSAMVAEVLRQKPAPPKSEGPGAAASTEFADQQTTGLKRAVVDTERLLRGAEPIPTVERQREETVVQAAEDRVDADATVAPSLISRIVDQGDKAISEHDAAVLLVERNRVMNERRQWEERKAEGEEVPQETFEEIEKQLERLDQAQRAAGSTWGRLGHMYQRMIQEDFTLEAMERKVRAAKQAPLTQAELATVKTQADKIAALQAQVEATKTADTEAEANAQVRQVYETTIKQLETELAARPKFGKEVFDIARGVVDRWKADAVLAHESLRSRLGRTSAGVDPTILLDVARIMRAKIGEAGLNLAEASTELLADFGDAIRPYLDKAWDKAQQMIAAEKVPAKVKEAVQKGALKTPKTTADIKAKAKAEAVAGEELSHKTVYDLARAHINAGVHGEDAVMKAVHADVKEFFPSMTERDVRRAYAEYGKVTFPSKEADKVELAELRQLVKMQEDIDRMEKDNEAALRAGFQRPKATQAIRDKIKARNDLLKKRQGPPSPEALATRDEAKQTALKNAIADADRELKTGEKKQREAGLPDSPAVERLRAELNAMREKLREIEAAKTSQKSADQKADEAAIKATEKAIAELDRRIREGSLSTAAKPGRDPSERLERLRSERDAMRAQLDEMRKAAKPARTPEEIYNDARMKAVRKQLAEVQARIAVGKYERPPKRVPKTKRPDVVAIELELAAEKQKFNKKLFEIEQAQRTLGKKIWDGIKQTLGTYVNIYSSLDFSAPRQMFFAMLSNIGRMATSPIATPKIVGRTIARMFQAWSNENTARRIEFNIQNRPNAKSGADKTMGIEYTALDTQKFTKGEENAHSILDEWAQAPLRTGSAVKSTLTAVPKIAAKPIRMSNRAFITALNVMRAELADHLLKVNFKDRAPTVLELQIIGNMVNIATGRGKVNPAAAKFASKAIWAPKLLISRIQTLALQPLWTGKFKGSARARRIVLKEYARAIAGGFVLLQIAHLFDDKEEEDSTSSDWGKIVRGQTRIDVWGGFQQVVVLLSRIAQGKRKTLKGEIKDTGAERKYGVSGSFYLLADFFRSKLRPDWGVVADVLDRKTFIGKKVNAGHITKALLPVPLSVQDLVPILKEHGLTEGMIIEALGQFGAGVQHYETDEQMKATR